MQSHIFSSTTVDEHKRRDMKGGGALLCFFFHFGIPVYTHLNPYMYVVASYKTVSYADKNVSKSLYQFGQSQMRLQT